MPGSIIDIFVAEAEGSTLFVVLQHPPDLREAAVAALQEPILAALRP